MANIDLDRAEQENCLLPSTSFETLDVRDIVNAGLPIIAYLKILAIGPFSIGMLAIVSAATTPWEHFPLVSEPTSAYTEGIPVPEALLFQTAAPKASRRVREYTSASLGGNALPALKVTDYVPELIINPAEILLPQVNLDVQLLPSTDSAVPRPPIFVEVE